MASIYALSADENSPVLAAPRHAITAGLTAYFVVALPIFSIRFTSIFLKNMLNAGWKETAKVIY